MSCYLSTLIYVGHVRVRASVPGVGWGNVTHYRPIDGFVFVQSFDTDTTFESANWYDPAAPGVVVEGAVNLAMVVAALDCRTGART